MSASFGGSLHWTAGTSGRRFSVVGDPAVDAANLPAAHYQITGSRFFETLGFQSCGAGVRRLRHGNGSTGLHRERSVRPRRVRARARFRCSLQLRVDAMSPEGPGPRLGKSSASRTRSRNRQPDDGNAIGSTCRSSKMPGSGRASWSGLLAHPPRMINLVKAAVARVDKNQAVGQVRTMDEVAAGAMRSLGSARNWSASSPCARPARGYGGRRGRSGVFGSTAHPRARASGWRSVHARSTSCAWCSVTGFGLPGSGAIGTGRAFGLTRFLEVAALRSHSAGRHDVRHRCRRAWSGGAGGLLRHPRFGRRRRSGGCARSE